MDGRDEEVTATRRRVARRYAAAVRRDAVGPTTLVHSDGGVVTVRDLERLLHEQVGFLAETRFRRSLDGSPNTVRWEALDDCGEVVSGRIVIHASVAADRISVWSEILLDGAAPRPDAPAHHEVNVDAAVLDDIARLGRRLLDRVRRDSRTPLPALFAEISRIVETAEGAERLIPF